MPAQRPQRDLETENRLRRTVAQSARLPASVSVKTAVNAVMCALTERLTAGGARALLDALPEPVGAMFELCVVHRAGKPTLRASRAEIVAAVAEHLGVTPAHAELVCSAVFDAVRGELDADTAHAIGAQLPRGLKELWLGAPIDAPDLDVEVRPGDARWTLRHELERRARLPAHLTAEAAFAAVMCSFARRLSGGVMRDVRLGLPPELRPLVDACAAHRDEEAEVLGRDELLAICGEHLGTRGAETTHIVREVLRVLRRNIPQDAGLEIESQLPVDLRALWREALPPHAG